MIGLICTSSAEFMPRCFSGVSAAFQRAGPGCSRLERQPFRARVRRFSAPARPPSRARIHIKHRFGNYSGRQVTRRMRPRSHHEFNLVSASLT
jgi:hypothetical protein